MGKLIKLILGKINIAIIRLFLMTYKFPYTNFNLTDENLRIRYKECDSEGHKDLVDDGRCNYCFRQVDNSSPSAKRGLLEEESESFENEPHLRGREIEAD